MELSHFRTAKTGHCKFRNGMTAFFWCFSQLSYTQEQCLRISRFFSLCPASWFVGIPLPLRLSFTSLIDVTLVVPQPAPILDYVWYPGATAELPGSYCFLASVRDCPIKLIDAVDRRVSNK